MELDHVLMIVEPGGPELSYLQALGLRETYRRRHPGQGTENICFCFDNLFLECLFITNDAEAGSDAVARLRLRERARWRSLGTNPFGLAWRAGAEDRPVDVPTWNFRPPYLPEPARIDVALDSDDPLQPLMFRSPGGTPPCAWDAGRRGVLQAPAGLGAVVGVTLYWPDDLAPAPALLSFAAGTILEIVPVPHRAVSLSLRVEKQPQSGHVHIALPPPP